MRVFQKTTRLLALTLMAVSLAASAVKPSLHGGGATFPFPIYAKWAYLYKAKTGAEINYISIGSGGGIEQMRSHTVDFGATEAPLPQADLDAMGVMQFPMVLGAVVLVANLEGLKPGELKLTGDVVAQIYLGKVTYWNDPAIRLLNPAMKLPDLPITVVERADGSGSTWLFTTYLTRVSSAWAKAAGAGKSVHWPVGGGAKGNEGVASFIKTLPGAFGYVQAAYATQNSLPTVALKNGSGKFVVPTQAAYKAAADQVDWSGPAGDSAFLLDLPGDGTWPITGASYVLVYKDQPDRAKADNLLRFFHWCLAEGAPVAAELGYVPLPAEAVRRVEQDWATGVKSGGTSLWKGGHPAPAKGK